MSRDELVGALATMAQSQGITVEEIVACMNGPSEHRTLAEHIDLVAAALSNKGTRNSYLTHFTRLRDGFEPQCSCDCEQCLASFDEHQACIDGCGRCDRRGFAAMGDLPLVASNFGQTAIEPLCELAERYSHKRAVLTNRRRAKNQQGAMPALGKGGRENCVGALRCLFKRAVGDHLLPSNPAENIPKPRRPKSKRRALTDTEVIDLFNVVVDGGDDPELDHLIVWADFELGCRAGGLLNMRVGGLNLHRQTVELGEKGGTTRFQPATRALIEDLQAHATRRGGPRCDPTSSQFIPDARVLYYRDSTAENPHPLTRKRLETLHKRVQRELPWAADMLFCGHALRHTAGTAIERIGGTQTAKAFLGHTESSTVDGYTKAVESEVARAFSVRTGEEHPLS